MPLTFSVVIPAYNQAEFLGEAIDSVLAQTYPHFELIVVNDASPDNTEEVVKQYSDPRVKYMRHAQNKGLPATRNTGMRAATGDCIALLDSDDYFHPEKLAVHAAFLEQHPEVDVTYNARFELVPGEKTIRSLHRPPIQVSLSDLIMGFPFAPSDMVIRKAWVDIAGLFDEELVNGAEDLDYPCRLALSGCVFTSVDLALNYRRYNLNKSRRSMAKRKEEYNFVLNRVFQDPRCPDSVLVGRNVAFAKQTLDLAFVSFARKDTTLAHMLLQEVINNDPTIIKGNPAQLMKALLSLCIRHSIDDLAVVATDVVNQWPSELTSLSLQLDWVVQQGYLRKMAQAAMWENFGEAEIYKSKAQGVAARVDDIFLESLLYQLIDIDEVLGSDKYRQAFIRLLPFLKTFGSQAQIRALDAKIDMVRAHRNFKLKNYRATFRNVMAVARKKPGALANRGLLSIFVRSLFMGLQKTK